VIIGVGVTGKQVQKVLAEALKRVLGVTKTY
jgi:hypothetical protein